MSEPNDAADQFMGRMSEAAKATTRTTLLTRVRIEYGKFAMLAAVYEHDPACAPSTLSSFMDTRDVMKDVMTYLRADG